MSRSYVGRANDVCARLGAIDQQAAHARGSHFPEGDFLLAGEGGHAAIEASLAGAHRLRKAARDASNKLSDIGPECVSAGLRLNPLCDIVSCGKWLLDDGQAF